MALQDYRETIWRLISHGFQIYSRGTESEYKADANIRNKMRSTTLDAAQYDAD